MFVLKSQWDEHKHPRDAGKFSSTAGRGGTHHRGPITVQRRPPSAPAADIRHNPTLDALFAAPTHKPSAPAHTDIRHNPLLESVMADKPSHNPDLDKLESLTGWRDKPADKPAATPPPLPKMPPPLPKRGERHARHGLARYAAQAVKLRGQGRGAARDLHRVLTTAHAIGGLFVGSEDSKPKPKKKPKAFALADVVVEKALWEEHKHPREHLGHFASKLKEHIGGLSGHPSEHAHADHWVSHLSKLSQAEVHHVAHHAGIEGVRPTDSKSSVIQRVRNRLTARARAQERSEV